MKILTKTTTPLTVLLRTMVITVMLASGISTVSMAKGADNNKQWYVRLIASAPEEGLKDRSNVLGQLSDSEDGCDSHDLKEIDPFGSAYLTIVFENDAWKECPGNYTSDFRSTAAAKQITWDFVVKSDDDNRTITLNAVMPRLVDNTKKAAIQEKRIKRLSKRMWLKEISSGRYYKAYIDEEAQSYDFEMNGEILKSFQWIYDTTGTIAKKYKKQKKEIRKAAKKEKRAAKRNTDDLLDGPPASGKVPQE